MENFKQQRRFVPQMQNPMGNGQGMPFNQSYGNPNQGSDPSQQQVTPQGSFGLYQNPNMMPTQSYGNPNQGFNPNMIKRPTALPQGQNGFLSEPPQMKPKFNRY